MKAILAILSVFFLFAASAEAQVVGLPPFPDQCDNGPAITLNSGTPPGGTYSGNGITGKTFDPGAAGAGVHPVTYSYTDTSGTTYDTMQFITVYPAPNIVLGNFAPLCLNDGVVNLDNGNPAGGTYIGDGIVFSNFFLTQNAGIGSHQIKYKYEDPATGCSDSATKNIVVNPLPPASLISFGAICEDQDDFRLLGGLPAGGSYVLNQDDTITRFDPAVYGADTFELAYHYTDNNNCTASDTSQLIINPVPETPFVFPFTPDTLLCSTPGDSYEWYKDGTELSVDQRKIGVDGDESNQYRVRVTRNSCRSEFSALYNYGEFVSTPELGTQLAVQVYPNPSNGDFQVRFDGAFSGRVIISDLSGRKLHDRVVSGQNLVEVSGLPNGVYSLSVISETHRSDHKVVVH